MAVIDLFPVESTTRIAEGATGFFELASYAPDTPTAIIEPSIDLSVRYDLNYAASIGASLVVSYVDQTTGTPWAEQSTSIKAMIDVFNSGANTAEAGNDIFSSGWIRIDVIDPATGLLRFIDNSRQMSISSIRVIGPLETELHKGILADAVEPWAGSLVLNTYPAAYTPINTGVDLTTVDTLIFHYRRSSQTWARTVSIKVSSIILDVDQGSMLDWHDNSYVALRASADDLTNGIITLRGVNLAFTLTGLEVKKRVDIGAALGNSQGGSSPTLREFNTSAIAGIVLKEHPLEADFLLVGNDAANGVEDGDTIILTTPAGFEHSALWHDGDGGTPRIGNIRRFIAAGNLSALPDPALWPAVDDGGRAVEITVNDNGVRSHYEHNGISWSPVSTNGAYVVGGATGGITEAEAAIIAGDLDDALQSQIDSNKTASDDADDALGVRIDAETAARGVLQTRVTDNEAAIDNAQQAANTAQSAADANAALLTVTQADYDTAQERATAIIDLLATVNGLTIGQVTNLRAELDAINLELAKIPEPAASLEEGDAAKFATGADAEKIWTSIIPEWSATEDPPPAARALRYRNGKLYRHRNGRDWTVDPASSAGVATDNWHDLSVVQSHTKSNLQYVLDECLVCFISGETNPHDNGILVRASASAPWRNVDLYNGAHIVYLPYDGSDVVPTIQAAIDSLTLTGRDEVIRLVRGDGTNASASMLTKLVLKSNITMVGYVTFKADSATNMPVMMDIATGATRVRLQDFVIDANDKVGTAQINLLAGYKDVTIDGVESINTAADGFSVHDMILSGVGNDLTIVNTQCSHAKRMLHTEGSLDTRIHNSKCVEIQDKGSFVRWGGATKYLEIFDNTTLGYDIRGIGGHLLNGETSDTSAQHTGVHIKRNKLRGLKDVAFNEFSGATQAEKDASRGATADMIAYRNTANGSIEDNDLGQAGSYGIVISDGSKDTPVKNNKLWDINKLGICVGVPFYLNTVSGICVSGNELINVGEDRLDHSNVHVQSAMRFWDTHQCGAINNTVRVARAYGLYVRSDSGAPPQDLNAAPPELGPLENTEFYQFGNLLFDCGLGAYIDVSPYDGTISWTAATVS